jgi:hypothetical protein
MSSPSLFWHEIIQNEDLKISLVGGDMGTGVTGIMTSGLGLSSDVKWCSPLDEALRGAAQSASNALMSRVAAQAVSWLKDMLPGSLPKETTLKNWVSSRGPSMMLDILFIAINKNDNVTVPVKILANTVFPQTKDMHLLMPPNGYLFGMNDEAVGINAITVEIGTWFKAVNMYLVDSMSVSFSKQVSTGLGWPLYAEVKLSLSPKRVIDLDEFQGFFSGG